MPLKRPCTNTQCFIITNLQDHFFRGSLLPFLVQFHFVLLFSILKFRKFLHLRRSIFSYFGRHYVFPYVSGVKHWCTKLLIFLRGGGKLISLEMFSKLAKKCEKFPARKSAYSTLVLFGHVCNIIQHLVFNVLKQRCPSTCCF